MHVGVGDAGVRKCLSPRVVLDYRGHLESDWCVRICVCVWFIDVHHMQFQMCAAFFGVTGGSSMEPCTMWRRWAAICTTAARLTGVACTERKP